MTRLPRLRPRLSVSAVLAAWCMLASAAHAAEIGTAAPAEPVRQGVEAWSRGDFVAAVGLWRGPAGAGDADAAFDLGQAYLMGRGVARDPSAARDWFGRAAKAGHVLAGDAYGIVLFQLGQQADAMPWLHAAATRGEPRALYVLGTATWNGDNVPADHIRGYALMRQAATTGLAQANASLAEMTAVMSLDERQRGAALADQLAATAAANRRRAEAAATLTPASASSQTAAAPAPASSASGVVAGADFADPIRLPPAPTPTPAPAPVSAPPAPPPPHNPHPAPVAAAPAHPTGAWRLQFGAFADPAHADSLWQRLTARPDLAGHPRHDDHAGPVIRLQATGYADTAAAGAACTRLKAAGFVCIVVKP